MKILMLAHFYPPELGGAGARLHGLARWLKDFGHDVTVITGFPNYPTGLVPKDYRGKLQSRETIDGVEVIRSWVYTSPKRGSLRRLSNYGSFVGSSALTGLLQGRRFDLVFASSPPLFIGLSGLFLARLWRVPLLFDIRDIWPELAVEAGEFSADAPMVRWGERLERFLYRQATHITVVTERKRQKLLDKGVPAGKLSVVTNGVDLDRLVDDNEAKDWRGDFKLGDKFLIVYAGLIGVFQGLDIAIDTAELLKDEDVHFLIIGDGVKKDALMQRAKTMQLSNISFLPSQPREVIPGLLHSADAALVPLVNDQLVDAVPSKLLEAWGCQLPTLLVAGGEAKRLLEQAGGGVSIPPGEPEQLASAIRELAQDPDKARDYGEAGYRYVAKHLDRPQLARELERVMQAVLAEQAGYAERT